MSSNPNPLKRPASPSPQSSPVQPQQQQQQQQQQQNPYALPSGPIYSLNDHLPLGVDPAYLPQLDPASYQLNLAPPAQAQSQQQQQQPPPPLSQPQQQPPPIVPPPSGPPPSQQNVQPSGSIQPAENKAQTIGIAPAPTNLSEANGEDGDEDGGKNKKRKSKAAPRTSRACLHCRKQKMRCEGAENPPCKRCTNMNQECLFERRSDYLLNPQDSAWQNRIESQLASLTSTVENILTALNSRGVHVPQGLPQLPITIPGFPPSGQTGGQQQQQGMYSAGQTGQEVQAQGQGGLEKDPRLQ